jgi:hypothetical protein
MLEQKLVEQCQTEIAQLNKMFKTRVKSGQVNEFVTQLFPEPVKSRKLNLFESAKN